MQEKPCHGVRQIQICSAGSHNFEGANAEADASVRSRTALVCIAIKLNPELNPIVALVCISIKLNPNLNPIVGRM
jgi:hypothetical protein